MKLLVLKPLCEVVKWLFDITLLSSMKSYLINTSVTSEKKGTCDKTP